MCWLRWSKSALMSGVLLFSVWFSALVHGAELQTVTFGGSSYYPPFHFTDADHRATGFDVELFEMIARESGWETDYRFGDWAWVQEELANGQVDLVPMFVSVERQLRYLFSDPINMEYHLLFGHPDRGSHRSLETLAGFRVAMEDGAYAMQELAKLELDIVLLKASSEAEALRMVTRGEADIALVPSTIARFTIADENLSDIVALSPPLLPVGYGFAVSPQRPELLDVLNEAILGLQRQGALDLLRAQWLEGEAPAGAPRYSFIVVMLLTMVAALAVLAFLAYRKRWQRAVVAMNQQSLKLRSARKKFRELSDTDPLTGLPDRNCFQNFLGQALIAGKQQNRAMAVGIVVLRDLERIQHTAGFKTADELVRKVADIIKGHYHGPSGYIGPGRFGFFFEGAVDRDEAIAQINSLIALTSQPIDIVGAEMHVQVTAGLALTSSHAGDELEIMRKADVAMIYAQDRGLPLLIYDSSMEPNPQNLMLMSDLRTTLLAGGLSWAYQPQFCVRSKRILGAEMLIRWQHPDHGWVPPDQFIVQAEESGLIKRVTQEVFKQAIVILQEWRRSGESHRLSINVSANDLSDREFVEEMMNSLGSYAKLLTLEITETAIMKDRRSIIANVELLKGAGVLLSLDDYGTGYSSLEYLKEFNFDEIKIDRTFIQDIGRSERNLTLTEASISLGHSLGAVVVAEGVEDEETITLLVDRGCDILQGYGISRPLEFKDFTQFVEVSRGSITKH